MNRFPANYSATGLKIAILVASFNKTVTDKLLVGAMSAFRAAKGNPNNFAVFRTPGAFELPQIAARLAKAQSSQDPFNDSFKGYHALVALGVIIKGETPHFDFISSSTIHGLGQVSCDYNLPIGMGVLTVQSLEQALARAKIYDNTEDEIKNFIVDNTANNPANNPEAIIVDNTANNPEAIIVDNTANNPANNPKSIIVDNTAKKSSPLKNKGAEAMFSAINMANLFKITFLMP